MAAVEPEIVAVLIQQEEFARQARRQHPLPFGHDRFSRADDANHGVFIGCQFGIESLARGRIGIIRHPVDRAPLRAELQRRARVTGHQIRRHLWMHVIEPVKQIFQQLTASAFHQQDAGERGHGF